MAEALAGLSGVGENKAEVAPKAVPALVVPRGAEGMLAEEEAVTEVRRALSSVAENMAEVALQAVPALVVPRGAEGGVAEEEEALALQTHR